jgi:hypothetical protein
MTVAGARKARDMVSTEQLSTLDPFHLGFWPASPRAFFLPARQALAQKHGGLPYT